MISMKQVAEKAGVSRTTVSFVLSGRYCDDMRISPEVAEKVKRTAKEMGYVRNELVQSMVSGKSRMIAIIAVFYDFMMPIIRGYSDTATQCGYSVKLLPINGTNDVNAAIKKAIEYRVDGIICMALSTEEKKSVNPELLQYGIPIAGLNLVRKSYFDQTASAMVGVEYLLENGHKKIGFLNQGTEICAERQAGYEAVMKKSGLEIKVFRADDGFEPLLAANLTAVFCSNDPLAMRFMAFLYKNNLRIPDYMSVLGFGNIVTSAFTAPALTTIDEPYYETGCLGFKRIYNLINNRKIQELEVSLLGKLVVRESVRNLN